MGAPVDESPAASAAPSSATDRPWREASKRFRLFLRRVPPTGLIAVLAGSQPDGLVAGALLWQALRRSGRAAELVIPTPDTPARSQEFGRRVAALAPAALVVAGLGDPRWVVPWACLHQSVLAIDHLPLTSAEPPVPPDQPGKNRGSPPWQGISGAGWTPPPSTSIIAFWLTQALADTRQQSWLAAVGALAALGERTAHPLVVAAKKAHGASWPREIVVLLRAVEHCAHPPVEAAVSLLLAAREPKEVVASSRPQRAALAAARAEVEAAIDGLRWVEPVAQEPLTLVQIDSSCAVQGVLAAIWANRRPERPVLVGNRGRRPGWVAFAALEPPGDDGLLSRRPWPISTLFDRAEGEDRAIRGQMPAAHWPGQLDCLGVTAGAGRATWAMPRGGT